MVVSLVAVALAAVLEGVRCDRRIVRRLFLLKNGVTLKE
jgi:hypothetical protein